MNYVIKTESAVEERICALITMDGEEALKIISECQVVAEDFQDNAARTYYELACELKREKRMVFEEILWEEGVVKRGVITAPEYVRLSQQSPRNMGGELVSLHLKTLCIELRRRSQEAKAKKNAYALAKAITDQDQDQIRKTHDLIKATDLSVDIRTPLEWNQVVAVAVEKAKQIMAGKEPDQDRTIDWPWPDVTLRHGGFRRGELCVVAGSPSMGKSSLMRQLMLHPAQRNHRSLMISLEVPAEDVAYLLAAGISGQSWSRLKALHPGDQNEFVGALNSLERLPIKIIHGMTSIGQIIPAIQKAHESDYLDVVAIDYLGLIKECEQTKNSTKASNIGSVVAAFKRVAIELNCLVLLGVQLNRDQMKDDNRRPKLIDLKDSGDIEAHADRVLIIHRPNEDPLTKREQRTSSDPEDTPRFFQDVIQEKGRNVGTTHSSFYFRRECAKFERASNKP